MAQILSARYTNKGGATQVQPLRNNNGTFVPFGNPYTPAGLSIDGNSNNAANLVVQFGAEFWCSAGRELRRYNPSTQNWDLDTTHANSANHDSGIYIGRGPSGALRAVILYRRTTNDTYYKFLDTPGGSWSGEFSTGLGNASITATGPGIVHNNQLHLGMGDQIRTLDIATLGSTEQLFTGSSAHQDPAFCRAQNRLFCLMWPGAVGANSIRNLYEFVGGAWVLVVDGTVETLMPRTGSGALPDVQTPNIAMHYDEPSDSLITHCYVESLAGNHGWLVSQIPLATLTGVTGIEATVVPGGIDYPNGPILANNDVRFVVEVDQDTDPLNPVTYVWISRDDGPWARYQWNGVASPMTALGSGGDRGLALGHNNHGGGERFYDGSSTLLPAYHIEEVQSRVALPGATRVFLRGSLIDETGGAPTPTDETVGLYWTKIQGQPRVLATILNAALVSGPGTAPVIVGNKITNFTFDNTSIYSVEWQAATDGLSNQDPHALMPHVEI